MPLPIESGNRVKVNHTVTLNSFRLYKTISNLSMKLQDLPSSVLTPVKILDKFNVRRATSHKVCTSPLSLQISELIMHSSPFLITL